MLVAAHASTVSVVKGSPAQPAPYHLRRTLDWAVYTFLGFLKGPANGLQPFLYTP